MASKRNRIYIKAATIKHFSDEDCIKALAFFLKIKRAYTNGIIYNYSVETLSEKLKVTKYQSRKQIKILKDLGLVFYEGNHLRTSSFRQLRELTSESCVSNGEVLLIIHRHDSLESVVTKLRFAYLNKVGINQQQNIIGVYDSLNELDHAKCSGRRMNSNEYFSKLRMVKRSMKKMKSRGYDFSSTEDRNKDIIFGYRKISEMLNISIASVKKFLQTLKNWGYIKDFKNDVEVVQKNMPSDFGLDIKSLFQGKHGFGHYFTHNGSLCVNKGTKIIIA